MEFGKLSNVDKVDFTLPPDPPENARALSFLPDRAAAEPASARVWIGTAGWSNRGFVGRLYPADARPADFLAHYARAFSTNELNSTYYGADAERARRWAAVVPSGFRFCPKLPAAVTHERELRDADRPMAHFLETVEAFGDRLGHAWGVLPPAFAPAHLPLLAAFLETWAPRLPLAMELRHHAWFSDPGASRAAFDLFERHGVAAVLTDVAGRRDVLHMRISGGTVFLRFVANGGHSSDLARLDAWIERLGTWIDGGLAQAYFFLHQPHDPDTVPLAEHLLPRLALRTGLELDAWRTRHALPRTGQLGLFDE